MKKLFLIPALVVGFAWVACDSNPNGSDSINSPGISDSSLQNNDPYQDQSMDPAAPGSTTDTSNMERNSDTPVNVTGDQSPEVEVR